MASLREYRRMKRTLSQTDGARLHSDAEALGRSLGLFTVNCDELIRFLDTTDDPRAALRLWAVQNREDFERFLDEVDRLLHNAVAAAMSLRQHSYRVLDKWLKPS